MQLLQTSVWWTEKSQPGKACLGHYQPDDLPAVHFIQIYHHNLPTFGTGLYGLLLLTSDDSLACEALSSPYPSVSPLLTLGKPQRLARKQYPL